MSRYAKPKEQPKRDVPKADKAEFATGLGFDARPRYYELSLEQYLHQEAAKKIIRSKYQVRFTIHFDFYLIYECHFAEANLDAFRIVKSHQLLPCALLCSLWLSCSSSDCSGNDIFSDLG